MDFSIHVKAYDQVTEWDPVKNQTLIKWVEGGEIIVGPTKRRGTGLHNRVLTPASITNSSERVTCMHSHERSSSTCGLLYAKSFHFELLSYFNTLVWGASICVRALDLGLVSDSCLVYWRVLKHGADHYSV